MAPDDAPLPQTADEQDRGEEHVDQLVGNQDDAEGKHDEAHDDEWRIDAEGTLNLVAADA